MKLKINGKQIEIDDAYSQGVLLWAIRDGAGLMGTKFGCGAGICGTCTVHVNGEAVRACITPVANVIDAEIRTLEGLLGEDGSLHPIQQVFIDEQVPQCSWCMAGQMMTATALLEQNSSPTEEEITAALSKNYCRCGCYFRIKKAVAIAAETMDEVS